jgi:hypothetical protein
MTPEQRRRRARIAAHASWANTADRAARTAAGTKAFLDRFERKVDPKGALPEHAATGRTLRSRATTESSILDPLIACQGHRSRSGPPDTGAAALTSNNIKISADASGLGGGVPDLHADQRRHSLRRRSSWHWPSLVAPPCSASTSPAAVLV